MPSAILPAGEKIECMHTVGDIKGYVPGKVLKFRLDKTYDIMLDDGTKLERIRRSEIRQCEAGGGGADEMLEEGQPVEARLKGKFMVSGLG
jgi:hypothetical protein